MKRLPYEKLVLLI